MKTKHILIFLSILLVAFFIAIYTHQIDGIDEAIYQFFHQRRSLFFDILFLTVTTFLNAFVICLICLIAMIIYQKKYILLIPLNLGLITLLSHMLKYCFQRPRPEANLIGEKGFSLPSAHACVAIAFFGFLIYLFIKEDKKKSHQTIALLMGGILIFLIGMSRIYLGVHYFSDVVVGYIVGTIYLILYIYILKRKDYLRN